MMAAVFDTAAIAERRRRLFGRPWSEEPPIMRDRERYGTAIDHCGICPKAPHQSCALSCTKAREDLNDGVTVA
jgi:hypothetical protein